LYTCISEYKAKICYAPFVDEGRKRTLGVIAAIFACRKLAVLEARPSPAREAAFSDALSLAEDLMRRIDRRWPLKDERPH
jgi:hypothetical protein